MKDSAAARRVVEPNIASQSLNDLFDDAEAEAGSALLPGSGAVGLREFLENMWLEIIRTTAAVIAHRYTNNIAILLYCDQDFSACRREFDRIREKIGNNLSKPVGIGIHFTVSRRSVESNVHAVALGESAILLNRVRHQRTQVDLTQIEHNAAGFELLDIENVVNEADQPLTVGVRDREETRGRFGKFARPLFREQTERAGNRRQRRAQFVADGRDEFVLQSFVVLAGADVADHQDSLGAFERTQHDLHRKLAPILSQSGELDPRSDLQRQGVPRGSQTAREQALCEALRNDVFHVLPEEFVRAVSEFFLRLEIRQHDTAAMVHHHHRIRSRLEQPPVSGFHPRHALFLVLAQADVTNHQNPFTAFERAEHDLDRKLVSLLAAPGEINPLEDLPRHRVNSIV